MAKFTAIGKHENIIHHFFFLHLIENKYLDVWESRKKVLSASGVLLEDAKNDLIDKIWTTAEGRPPKPNDPLMIHDTKYAGNLFELIGYKSINKW